MSNQAHDPESWRKLSKDKVFEAFVEFMKLLLSNLFLVNGAAAGALITFFDSIETNQPALVTSEAAKSAIIYFAAGAGFAVAAAGLTALGQGLNSLHYPDRFYQWPGYIALLLMFMSGLCFVVACLAATGAAAWFLLE